MVDWALKYAAMGWRVFPVHSVEDGVCSCKDNKSCKEPGKHPRIKKWQVNATTSENQIRHWWKMWPAANIAIATGEESGILVLDFDPDEYTPVMPRKLPDTLCSQTGGGGQHYVFNYPRDGEYYKSKTRAFDRIDSRSNGGYIIAPPSSHKSGNEYFWDTMEDDISNVEIKNAPEWFLSEIKRHTLKIEDMPIGGDGLPLYAREALDSARSYADNYDTWILGGMAIHFADSGKTGLSVFNWWSSLSKNYSIEAVHKEWQNFSKKEKLPENPVTFDTVFKWAMDQGWENPVIETGESVAKNIIESAQRKIADKIKETNAPVEISSPAGLIPKDGLIKEICDYILKTSVRPQPELALAATLSFIGALAGRKYQTETGLRTNVYFVGVAESGAGKDHARKALKKLAHESGTLPFIGGEDFASGQAIVTALQRHPSQLFMIDEFGLKLQAVTDPRASSHQKDIVSTLMVLYSSAGSIYSGREYADQKNKPRVEIHNPNACIYGTSVPSEFYKALTSSHGVNGTIARFIMVESPKKRPIRQKPEVNPSCVHLADKIKDLSEQVLSMGNLAKFSTGMMDTSEPLTVPMTNTAYETWEMVDDYCGALMVSDVTSSIYSRVAENASKLALIYAVGKNMHEPEIDNEAMMWASELSMWAANSMINKINEMVSDNHQESNVKKVLRVVKYAGKDGVTKSDITRKTQFLKRRDREDILASLIEAENILVSVSAENGKKPKTRYFFNQ